MAQKYVVQLIDDLTQETIEEGEGESVHFALDGVNYAIDLSAKHADDFRAVLGSYIDAGRKAEFAGKAKASTSAGRAPKADTKGVREWASENGFTVSTRGRIPSEVQQAYDAR